MRPCVHAGPQGMLLHQVAEALPCMLFSPGGRAGGGIHVPRGPECMQWHKTLLRAGALVHVQQQQGLLPPCVCWRFTRHLPCCRRSASSVQAFPLQHTTQTVRDPCSEI